MVACRRVKACHQYLDPCGISSIRTKFQLDFIQQGGRGGVAAEFIVKLRDAFVGHWIDTALAKERNLCLLCSTLWAHIDGIECRAYQEVCGCNRLAFS